MTTSDGQETPGQAAEMTLRSRVHLLMSQWESNASRHSFTHPAEQAVARRYADDLRAVLAADRTAQPAPPAPPLLAEVLDDYEAYARMDLTPQMRDKFARWRALAARPAQDAPGDAERLVAALRWIQHRNEGYDPGTNERDTWQTATVALDRHPERAGQAAPGVTVEALTVALDGLDVDINDAGFTAAGKIERPLKVAKELHARLGLPAGDVKAAPELAAPTDAEKLSAALRLLAIATRHRDEARGQRDKAGADRDRYREALEDVRAALNRQALTYAERIAQARSVIREALDGKP